MIELINVCKRNTDNSLTVVETKKLKVELNIETMRLFAKYAGKTYRVKGTFDFQYLAV